MAQSLAERLADLTAEQRAVALAGIDPVALLHDWSFWGRPEQQPPSGNWNTWLILTGRGWGKTRTGAEWVRMRARDPNARIALIGATAADARDVMCEGESGLLAIHPDKDRPFYEPSKRRLTWPNGAMATTYSADEPDRLRGPQHTCGWFDELAAWRYPETYDMAMFGMRLGENPQVVITTTPKPQPLLHHLLGQKDGSVVVTRGSTYDNRVNLSPIFLKKIAERYGQTRLGRQEIAGEMLDDVPGALWPRALLEASRLYSLPEGLPPPDSLGYKRVLARVLGLSRIVIGVDPSGARDADDDAADEIGLIAAGCDFAGRGFLLEDGSGTYSPEGWGAKAVQMFDAWGADMIVAEANFGGGMVASTIRAVRRTAPTKLVVASRGKALRAEPVAALYEQGRVQHVGTFPKLEDQLSSFTRSGYHGRGSPDRADAAVFALTDLLLDEQPPYDLMALT